jgi:hypothetical protein
MAKKENKNKSVSLELLESYRNALYAIKGFLDRASKDLNDGNIEDIETELKISIGISNLGKELGKNIESLDKLEEKVKKEESLSTTRRGNSQESLFEV